MQLLRLCYAAALAPIIDQKLSLVALRGKIGQCSLESYPTSCRVTLTQKQAPRTFELCATCLEEQPHTHGHATLELNLRVRLSNDKQDDSRPRFQDCAVACDMKEKLVEGRSSCPLVDRFIRRYKPLQDRKNE